jgi:hypothetical protein
MNKNPILAPLLSWLIPGAGHYVLGKKNKAVLYFCVITVLYLCGFFMAEFTNLSIERHPIYFYATYMFIASYSFIGLFTTGAMHVTHHIKLLDLGCLYTSVACLLNLLVIIDCIALAGRKE